jgi:hypothetical protein
LPSEADSEPQLLPSPSQTSSKSQLSRSPSLSRSEPELSVSPSLADSQLDSESQLSISPSQSSSDPQLSGRLERKKFVLSVRPPRRAKPGSAVDLTLEAGWHPGSPRQLFRYLVPLYTPKGAWLKVQVWLCVPSSVLSSVPPSVTPSGPSSVQPLPGNPRDLPRRRREHSVAASKVAEEGAEAELLSVGWAPEPTPCTLIVAWPLREPPPSVRYVTREYYGRDPRSVLSLHHGYYGFPGRAEQFTHQFGFESWDDAMAFFDIVFSSDVEPGDGVGVGGIPGGGESRIPEGAARRGILAFRRARPPSPCRGAAPPPPVLPRHGARATVPVPGDAVAASQVCKLDAFF